MFATEYSLPFTGTYVGLLMGAVATDIWSRRIPNLLSIVLAVLGLGAQFMTHGWRGGLSGVISGAIIFGLLFLPWLKGGLGGGDVKLASAAAISLGLSKLITFALVGAMAGGVVAAVCYLLSSAAARQSIRNNVLLSVAFRALPAAAPAEAGRLTVPYAIAVATGALFALFAPRGVQWAF